MRDQRTQQRLNALIEANATRVERSEMKARIKSGEVSLKAVLWHDVSCLRSMTIGDLLCSAPAMRKAKPQRALRACRIDPLTPLHRLPTRDRERLLHWLEDRYPAALGKPKRSVLISETKLRHLHHRYVTERLSARELAAEFWREAGYASVEVAASKLILRWRRRGLPLRTRREASEVHGEKRRAGPPRYEDEAAYYRWWRARLQREEVAA